MIHFGHISKQRFLEEYWQKKPLLIKNALPNFISPLSPDELAGLSCEEEFESRIVTGSTSANTWTLEGGPFNENTFKELPDGEWTLLVQGVDRYINEVHQLINEFDFIPRWRFDDVMISFATLDGSVGPHYDHYDVFLLQGLGRRRWTISRVDCNPKNFLEDTPLRIMKNFIKESTWEAEPGDIVYIPPEVAHHGVSLDDECITLSIGYRSYLNNEMFNSLELPINKNDAYLKDPTWEINIHPAEISQSAIEQSKSLLNINELPDNFFGCFVTKLDPEDEKKFNEVRAYQMQDRLEEFGLYHLHPICRIAYQFINKELRVFVNGEVFNCRGLDDDLVIDFSNKRQLKLNNKNKELAEQLMSLCLIEKST
jgi:50S ribosomal protein L16 3-hydroxylase